MNLSAQLAPVPVQELRRTSRRAIDFGALLRDMGATASPVQLRDLTEDGCKVYGFDRLHPGQDVWLKIPGLHPQRASVAWVRNAEAGCEFSRRLDDSLLEQVLAVHRRQTKRLFSDPVVADSCLRPKRWLGLWRR